jgi:hypothetical protein
MVKGKSTKVNGVQFAFVRGNWIQALPWCVRGFIRGEAAASLSIMQASALPHFRTVPVHRMVELLCRQPIPRILLVGAYRLSG